MNARLCDRPFAKRRGDKSAAGLLGRRGSSHIARFVMAVVVNAVERSAGLPFANIRQKRAEFAPPLAHPNAASAVKGVRTATSLQLYVGVNWPPRV